MSALRPFLLDTNILIHLIRQNAVGRRINTNYDLTSQLGNSLLSVVTLGEISALAVSFGWGRNKIEKLDALVQEVVTLNINNSAIIARYGEFKCLTDSNGRRMSDNDLWIAATASVVDAILLTADKDFDFLAGQKLIKRIWIDEQEDSRTQ